MLPSPEPASVESDDHLALQRKESTQSVSPHIVPSDLPWARKRQALVMILLLNCAAYWFGASLGPLKTVLKNELQLDNSQYAVIAVSGHLVNTAIPVVSGVAIDYYGAAWLSLGSSIFILIGAVIAGAGASTKSYVALVVGEVIVGLGSATIETAQLKLYATFFRGSHLGLVLGINHSFNHFVILIAQSTAIPITDGTHSWTWAIWMPVFLSTLALIVNIGYFVFERRLPGAYQLPPVRQQVAAAGKRGFGTEMAIAWNALNNLPAVFWIITLTQLLQDATVQTYGVLTPSIYSVTRGTSQLSAGLLAAIARVPVVVLCPFLGYIMDRVGYRMHFSPISSALFLVVFALAGWTQVNAAACSVIQGLGLSFNFLPFTVAVPILVPSLQYMGTAQGIYAAFINAGHVIVVTAAGAIQDASPTGRHQYNRVLLFLLAIKSLDMFFGIFYIVLDRISLNSILTQSEPAQKQRDLDLAAGAITERRSRIRSTMRSWTVMGLTVGLSLVIAAWGVYIRYAVK